VAAVVDAMPWQNASKPEPLPGDIALS